MDQDSSKKRTRDEFDVSSSDSPETKLARVDSDANTHVPEPDRDDSGEDRVDPDNSVVNSPEEAKRIQDDLLDIFDDSDEPAIQGLDSVIRSFEEEILVGAPVPEMSLHSGGSQPDLGYLLEASDDELGLPPTFTSGEDKSAAAVSVVSAEEEGPGTVGFGWMLGFENEIPNYDSFEFGLGGNPDGNQNDSDNNGDFVALGGLFDHSDENFVPADISGLQWQPELSAL
ncbi:unnamed protein product [Dovyalis caffra]|uniref:Uncharacterized protein n=1 Tax=Dovyalis caffra TaxID=77055 RepID=A0AAV1SG27_9ROSI|nr:unnamed protein product [Dovyalis caffra]